MLIMRRREKTYKAGGCLSVTSRILIVDLLNKKMDVSKITGLVILHAETSVLFSPARNGAE